MSWLDAGQGAPSARVWEVSALVKAIADTLSARYGTVLVRGEISGFSRASSGHGYFTLKDEGGQAGLRCAMFRRALSQVNFQVTEGQLVEARGSLSVYEARGELQMVVDSLRPAGTGSLHEQFLRLKARLEAEGLFDQARKRPFEAFPRRVAVVTSLGAAALRDVVTALRRRAPYAEVVVAPCLVQGHDAPLDVVAALEAIARWHHSTVQAGGHGVDTVLVCRGGGSPEDLWAFNDERVVRAIVACPIPVICGVGHETDVSLADFAADLRAPTPTAAAEIAASARDEALSELASVSRSLAHRMRQRLDREAQGLDLTASRLVRPARLVMHKRHAIDMLGNRLGAAMRERLASSGRGSDLLAQRLERAVAQHLALARHRQTSLEHRLVALDPRRVLERGYAWLTDASGQPITSVQAVVVGQRLNAVLSDGSLGVDVARVNPLGSPESP